MTTFVDVCLLFTKTFAEDKKLGAWAAKSNEEDLHLSFHCRGRFTSIKLG